MDQIYQITGNHEPLADLGNGKFVYSRLTNYQREDQVSAFSVKMVLQGSERYVLNGKRQQVKAGSYLLVNEGSEVSIGFNNKEAAHGVCLYPPQAIIDEVSGYFSNSEEALIDQPDQAHSSVSFIEKIYDQREDALGQYLYQQVPEILASYSDNTPYSLHQFYWGFAEQLIASQTAINHKLAGLDSVKKSTREELFRRVSEVKVYIDDHFTENISLSNLAALTCLSRYHLIRSFKSVYGQSPYQYILAKRLTLAETLRATEDLTWEELTLRCGFSDVKNLRKALRKRAQNS